MGRKESDTTEWLNWTEEKHNQVNFVWQLEKNNISCFHSHDDFRLFLIKCDMGKLCISTFEDIKMLLIQTGGIKGQYDLKYFNSE